jgi:hypothetical protein
MKNRMHEIDIPIRAVSSISVLVATMALTSYAQAEGDYKFYGDVTEAVSVNMQNAPETQQNDKYKLSMARSTLHLNLDGNLSDNFGFVLKGRAVKEVNLPYLRDLQKLGGNAADKGDLVDQYNESRIREAYFDLKGDRLQLRLGQQQVAWGESDFFQAMDMVHGYDFTWRSFLEPDNEELRKPLMLANLTVQVPEVDGKVQLLLRPGKLNRKDSTGNTYDIFGGRWANQPNKGVDFRTITPYNYSNPTGNSDDNTYGVRWSGTAKEINYSLSYLKTYNSNPVISPSGNLALFGLPGAASGSTPFQGVAPIGTAGEVIYPKVSMYGLTASGYSAALDAVFSTEVAYVQDYAYNYGYSSALSAALGPGFDGVKRKNLVKSMVRMDKNLSFTQSLLGTEKPAFFSVQVFDTWIQNFQQSENLVQLVGFGQASKKHSTLVTGILGLSYANGTVLPNVVVGHDASYGGGFLVPSVSFEFGKHVRLKVEYDHFWNSASRTAGNAATERNTALFGYFDNNDQLYAKLTYQF